MPAVTKLGELPKRLSLKEIQELVFQHLPEQKDVST